MTRYSPMFDRDLRLFAFNLGYARQLLGDVPDEQLAEQPAEGANHPAWLLGQPSALPKEWHDLFDSGSVPSPERSLYPSKADLLAAYEAAHRRLSAAVTEHPADRLSKPNPVESLRAALPTVADLLAHLLTTHEATHLGQLSAWRRQIGLPPV